MKKRTKGEKALFKKWINNNYIWLRRFGRSMFSYISLAVILDIFACMAKIPYMEQYLFIFPVAFVIFGLPAFVLQVCLEKLWNQIVGSILEVKAAIQKIRKKR